MRIAFAGAQGTGKTTVAKVLANELGVKLLPPISRLLLSEMGCSSISDMRSKNLEPDFQRKIVERRLLTHTSEKNYVADRSIFDAIGYDAAIGLTDINYDRLIRRYRLHYDAVLFLPIEFPISDDGVRALDLDEQVSVSDEIYASLLSSGIPHAVITGSIEERVERSLVSICSLYGPHLLRAYA